MITNTEIQDKLTNTVLRLYQDQPNTFNKMDLISEYQAIYETTSFLFEDYRTDFETNMRAKSEDQTTEENLSMEGVIFTSWIALTILHQLCKYYETANSTLP